MVWAIPDNITPGPPTNSKRSKIILLLPAGGRNPFAANRNRQRVVTGHFLIKVVVIYLQRSVTSWQEQKQTKQNDTSAKKKKKKETWLLIKVRMTSTFPPSKKHLHNYSSCSLMYQEITFPPPFSRPSSTFITHHFKKKKHSCYVDHILSSRYSKCHCSVPEEKKNYIYR